jgi:hypothetical protein
MSERLRRRVVGFTLFSFGFVVALGLLAATAYFAPIHISLEHSPKLVYAAFAFALGMLFELFVSKKGFRRPGSREVKAKLPLIVVAFLLCLPMLWWMEQLSAYESESKALAAACQTLREDPQVDEFGPVITEKVLRAEQRAISAARAIASVKFVRHPPVSENAPCD